MHEQRNGDRSLRGIETVEQLEYLRLQGCDEIQGYYVSRPVAAADMETLLKADRWLPQPGGKLRTAP